MGRHNGRQKREKPMTSSGFGLNVSLKGSCAARVTPQRGMLEVVGPLRGGLHEKQALRVTVLCEVPLGPCLLVLQRVSCEKTQWHPDSLLLPALLCCSSLFLAYAPIICFLLCCDIVSKLFSKAEQMGLLNFGFQSPKLLDK